MLNFNTFLSTLPVMFYGVLGIFIVIGFIMLCVKVLITVFPAKKG